MGSFWPDRVLADIVETPFPDPSLLTRAEIASRLPGLSPYRVPFRERHLYVNRTDYQTTAWAAAFVAAEVEHLEATWVSGEHGYDVVMTSARDLLAIGFRLHTRNRAGYTKYRIRIRRVGSYFACSE